jgi:hypothetical protein
VRIGDPVAVLAISVPVKGVAKVVIDVGVRDETGRPKEVRRP